MFKEFDSGQQRPLVNWEAFRYLTRRIGLGSVNSGGVSWLLRNQRGGGAPYLGDSVEKDLPRGREGIVGTVPGL